MKALGIYIVDSLSLSPSSLFSLFSFSLECYSSGVVTIEMSFHTIIFFFSFFDLVSRVRKLPISGGLRLVLLPASHLEISIKNGECITRWKELPAMPGSREKMITSKWSQGNGWQCYIETLYDWFPTPLESNANSQVFSLNSLNKNLEKNISNEKSIDQRIKFFKMVFIISVGIKERE
jgi:hypothetical protein